MVTIFTFIIYRWVIYENIKIAVKKLVLNEAPGIAGSFSTGPAGDETET